MLDAIKVELARRREASGDTAGRIESTGELLARLGFGSVDAMREWSGRVVAEADERGAEHRRRQAEQIDRLRREHGLT